MKFHKRTRQNAGFRVVSVSVAFLLGILLLVAGCFYPSTPTVETTANKDAEWCRNWFASKLLSLQKDGESVVAVYGRKTDDQKRRTEKWVRGFIIQCPDDHGSSSCTVDSIDQSGVILSYTNSFDHRSFGKNLISNDRGTFRLSWLTTEFLRYEGTQPELTVSLLPASQATPKEITRVGDTAKQVFDKLCSIKSEIWPEPATIIELADVWHVEFRAKDRVLSVNGKQMTVQPEASDGMKIPLMKPNLTCALLGSPIRQPEASKTPEATR